jgi:hypothetical protein
MRERRSAPSASHLTASAVAARVKGGELEATMPMAIDRPQRSAADAIKAVHELLCQGYTDVVDADLSKYLDPVSQGPPGS